VVHIVAVRNPQPGMCRSRGLVVGGNASSSGVVRSAAVVPTRPITVAMPIIAWGEGASRARPSGKRKVRLRSSVRTSYVPTGLALLGPVPDQGRRWGDDDAAGDSLLGCTGVPIGSFTFSIAICSVFPRYRRRPVTRCRVVPSLRIENPRSGLCDGT
jgi:hypothetical protein